VTGEPIEGIEGRLRRTCLACGVEIDVARPPMPFSKNATRHAREDYAASVRRQVLWEFMCDECRAWWNQRLRALEHSNYDRPHPTDHTTDRPTEPPTSELETTADAAPPIAHPTEAARRSH